MLSGLILTAFLMGLGGVPHCATMCGAACAALLPRGVPLSSLLGRCVGYAMLGAVAAASAGLVAQWGRQFAFLQPLWILAQALALLLGVYLAWTGRMPSQLDTLGHDVYRALQRRVNAVNRVGGAPTTLRRRAWPFVAGMAWAMLPCGLLYAALMVAVLAPTAAGGALVMLAFALPGAVGVWAAPAIIRRLTGLIKPSGAGGVAAPSNGAQAVVPVLWLRVEPDGEMPPARGVEASQAQGEPATWSGRGSLVDPRWAVRVGGFMLALMSAWALYHQVMAQWRAWCA